MNIVIRGIMPDGTSIQIEDWTCEFPNHYVTAAYPISKVTLPGAFSPSEGQRFRYGINFESLYDASECAGSLMSGKKKLADYGDCLERREYIKCV